MPADPVIFEEKQKLDSIWAILIIALMTVFNYVRYFYYEEQDLQMFYRSMIGASLVAALFSMLRLYTKIDKNQISYRFLPFLWKWKTIQWSDVVDWEMREYSPISEYGGWGIRSGPSGKAYTLSGKAGLQLTMKSGKKILFGTKKSSELADFLTSGK